MKKTLNFGFIIVVILFACKPNSTQLNKKNYFDITGFFNKEIADLRTINPSINKTISTGEKLQSVDNDSVNWEKELSPFFQLEINKVALENKYQTSIDSNKSLQIVTYYSSDTNTEVQRILITTLNGKIQLIEAETKKRSWMVDRDIKYSYMPKKGYGILMSENYIWGEPKRTEIFAQINNPKELYR